MKKFLLMVLLALACLHIRPSWAQDQKCEALLKDGVRDYSGQSADYFQYEKFKSWLQNNQAKTLQQAEQDANNLGIGVEEFSVNSGSTDANTNYQQWKSEFLSKNYFEVIGTDKFKSIMRTVNQGLAEAFVKCVNGQFGTAIWIDASSDTEFAIFFQFTPPEGSTLRQVNVKRFTATNSTCQPTLNSIRTVGPVANIQCRKISAQATAAVSLSTSEFSPSIQPKFAPIIPPKPPAAVTIAGAINASAIRLSQHSIDFSISGAPSAEELRNATAGRWFSWTTNVTHDIDEFDFVINPQISPTVAHLLENCTVIGTSVNKIGPKLNVSITSRCQMWPYLGNTVFDSQVKLLKDGGFSFLAHIAAEQRLPVQAGAKQIFESNSAQSSWSFQYDLPHDPALVWTYFFDVKILSEDVTYHLFRTSDGKQQQLADGPFRAVFSDNQNLTIYRVLSTSQIGSTQLGATKQSDRSISYFIKF